MSRKLVAMNIISTVLRMLQVHSLDLLEITVDWITKNIYYVGWTYDEIGVCEVVREERAIVVKNSRFQIRDITLNPEAG